MLPFISSPFTIPLYSFCTKPGEALRGAVIPDVIWNFDSIFVNPFLMPHHVRIPQIPQMIAAPNTLTPDAGPRHSKKLPQNLSTN